MFLGRLEATIVALNKDNGKVVWKTTVENWQDGYSITMAPQYVDAKVTVGVSGAE